MARFDDPWNFFCGILKPNLLVGLNQKTRIKTRVATACPDPQKHSSRDGVHFSEAATQWLVKKIFDGSVSDPSIPLNQACP